MKTLFKFAIILILFVHCDNDSTSYENDDQCNYQGLSWVDSANNTTVEISDTALSTKLFASATAGGNPAPYLEISGVNSAGTSVLFITSQILIGSSKGKLIIDGGDSQSVNVTCQRAGTAVGDEFRYDVVTLNGLEFEFCVTIDQVL